MPYFKLKNIEDAIIALQEITEFLKSIEVSHTHAAKTTNHISKKPAKKDVAPVDITTLAQSVRSLPRAELIETLSKLSASTLRSLSYQIGLRGISKRPKEYLIESIVRELIDFPDEHRKLSTFSQRKIEEAK